MEELDEIKRPRTDCAWCLTRHVPGEHISKQRRWEKHNIEKVRASTRERARRFRAAHLRDKVIGN